MKTTSKAALAAAALSIWAGTAAATPSTQIWIPSTDVQDFGTLHLNYDAFVRVADEATGQRKAPVLMLGPTVGASPFERLELEAGFDLVFQGDPTLDKKPLYLHAKLGTPESAWFDGSPALAFGIYNVGLDPDLTMQNVGYGLVATTLPVIGRLSAGYFLGRSAVLRDPDGSPANRGLLLSWDRAMTELSDKLWLAVDYQGSDSALGALSVGGSWLFSERISVLVGYDHYLNSQAAGRDTFTVQLDLNL